VEPVGIDLAADRAQWDAMEDRSLVAFVLGSLMVAEERITTKFSGLVGAHDSEEEATFLSTQQVDEARHMQFHARFQDEVVAEPALIAAHVERAREHVSPAFCTIFDDKLVAAHDRLLALGDVVRQTLRELLPAVAESLTPPAAAPTRPSRAPASCFRSCSPSRSRRAPAPPSNRRRRSGWAASRSPAAKPCAQSSCNPGASPACT
jgi:hypothetical protein